MANLPIEYHPEARREAYDALDWYFDRSSVVAARFQQELEKAQRVIQESPNSWAEYQFGTRRYLIKRFQIVVVYRIVDLRIEIIAVAHGRRKPGYWANRLTPPT